MFMAPPQSPYKSFSIRNQLLRQCPKLIKILIGIGIGNSQASMTLLISITLLYLGIVWPYLAITWIVYGRGHILANLGLTLVYLSMILIIGLYVDIKKKLLKIFKLLKFWFKSTRNYEEEKNWQAEGEGGEVPNKARFFQLWLSWDYW